MSQVEDIQPASESMGLEVTRVDRARVRVNLESDCADRKAAMELSDVTHSRGKGKGPGEAEGSGGTGKKGRCRKEVSVRSPRVISTGKCKLVWSGLRVGGDEEVKVLRVESH